MLERLLKAKQIFGKHHCVFFRVHTSPWVSGGMRMGMVMWKEQFLCSCFWRLLLLPRWCTNEAKNRDIDNYSANSISNPCRTGPFGCCINNIRSKRLFCSLVPIPPKILALLCPILITIFHIPMNMAQGPVNIGKPGCLCFKHYCLLVFTCPQLILRLESHLSTLHQNLSPGHRENAQLRHT